MCDHSNISYICTDNAERSLTCMTCLICDEEELPRDAYVNVTSIKYILSSGNYQHRSKRNYIFFSESIHVIY